jgi:hypothetical protein
MLAPTIQSLQESALTLFANMIGVHDAAGLPSESVGAVADERLNPGQGHRESADGYPADHHDHFHLVQVRH